jgi:dihydrodipicolinate synthase/N-acetylneuraminate lyase
MAPPPIHGIIPPLITPLTPGLELDVPSLERLIEHVLRGGVYGLFLLGSTGEGPSLTDGTRKAVIRESIRVVSGRVPVFVNISSPSFLETCRMAEYAAREGAGYTVLSPPYYYDMNTPELLGYYRSVADRSPLPLVIYNAPRYTGIPLEPSLVGELISHENIVGIKDSSGEMDYVRELLHRRADFSFPILIGPENMLGSCLLLGCEGGVCGGANLYPRLYVSYYLAAMEKNRKKMDRFREAVRSIQTNLYEVADSPMGIVIGLKYLLEKRGLCSGYLAMPVYQPLTDKQKRILDTLDQAMQPL